MEVSGREVDRFDNAVFHGVEDLRLVIRRAFPDRLVFKFPTLEKRRRFRLLRRDIAVADRTEKYQYRCIFDEGEEAFSVSHFQFRPVNIIMVFGTPIISLIMMDASNNLKSLL